MMNDRLEKTVYRKCNRCGNVYCLTETDIKVSPLADYDKCPECGEKNVKALTLDEYRDELTEQAVEWFRKL